MRSIAFALLLAACGSTAPPTVPANVGTAPESRNDRAIATLHRLAAAIHHGGDVSTVIDPGGAWAWYQPGAVVGPMFPIAADEHQTIDELAVAAGWQDGWGEYGPQVADAIEIGLARLDLDPADTTTGRYDTDCGDERMPAPARAMLRTHDVDVAREPGWADHAGAAMDPDGEPRPVPMAFYFRYNTVAVYLAEHGRDVTVTHLLLWSACDA